MTAPSNPTPATLDAAVVNQVMDAIRAAARGRWIGPTAAHDYAVAALAVIQRAHVDQLAQAHAAGTAKGATAERERWTTALSEMAVGIEAGSSVGGENPCCETCPAWALNHAADAIARAGTSGDAT